jgi:hypothetical protein
MKIAMKTQQTIRTWKQISVANLRTALAIALVAGGVCLSGFAQPSPAKSPAAAAGCSMGQGMKCGMMQSMGTNCTMTHGTNMCCASTNHMASCPMMQPGSTNHMMGGKMSCSMMQSGSTNQIMGGKMASCPMMQSGKPNAPASQAAYTCPMHPEVGQDKPGTCPKCGMKLVAKR